MEKIKNKKELIEEVIWLLKWLNLNKLKEFKHAVKCLNDELNREVKK